MSHRLRLLVFLAAALVVALAAPFAAAEQAAAPPSADLERFLAALAAEDGVAAAPTCAAPAAAEAAPAGELQLACSCISRCSTNRDCDRVCGKGLGQCVQVNSCCTDCICAATFAIAA